MRRLKVLLVFSILLITTPIIAQSVVSVYQDDNGRVATVTTTTSALYIEQGGITKAFNIYNMDGAGFYFTNPEVGMAFVSVDCKQLMITTMSPPAAYKFRLVQSQAGNAFPYQGGGVGSGSSTNTSKRQCGYCDGTGACPFCNSAGQSKACVSNMYGVQCTDAYCIAKNHRCSHCNGTHRCSNCNGTGHK